MGLCKYSRRIFNILHSSIVKFYVYKPKREQTLHLMRSWENEMKKKLWIIMLIHSYADPLTQKY